MRRILPFVPVAVVAFGLGFAIASFKPPSTPHPSAITGFAITGNGQSLHLQVREVVDPEAAPASPDGHVGLYRIQVRGLDRPVYLLAEEVPAPVAPLPGSGAGGDSRGE